MNNINKKLSAAVISAIFLAGAFVVFAQVKPEAVKNKEVREKAKNERQEAKQEAKTKAQNTRQDARKEIDAKRSELKQQLEAKKEEAKKRIESAREEAKTRAKAAREEFKKKMETIRDARKKEIAIKLDEQINRLNERWTTHFANVLDHLDNVLGKIQIRADKAISLGKDVSSVKSAIEAAKSAIANARSAVEAQAKKSYTISFSSEEQMRTAFKAAKDQLHKDLTALRDGAMKIAREAVQNAAKALSAVPRVNDEPAESAVQAPTSAQEGEAVPQTQ